MSVEKFKGLIAQRGLSFVDFVGGVLTLRYDPREHAKKMGIVGSVPHPDSYVMDLINQNTMLFRDLRKVVYLG